MKSRQFLFLIDKQWKSLWLKKNVKPHNDSNNDQPLSKFTKPEEEELRGKKHFIEVLLGEYSLTYGGKVNVHIVNITPVEISSISANNVKSRIREI